MGAVAVLASSGKRLMPTNPYRARKLLKRGRARIEKYRPVFTIRILDREDGHVQDIEYKSDTGYQHAGVSICSETKEYVNRQYDMLQMETERHNDCRKYRRARRNRLRYRKIRFDNRTGKIRKAERDGGKWFAPSLVHRMENQIRLFTDFCRVMPVTKAYFEMGQFDTQLLKAVEAGDPLPEGTDYQKGEQYGYATLREAVFGRDHYTCICCNKDAFKDGAVLRIHHLGYLKGDRSNRMSNLATVCTKCHTAKNHKPGGKLHGLNPELKPFRGATYMTAVRFEMYRRLKRSVPDTELHMTYGASTKLSRKALSIRKTHSNDAYAMGRCHPVHRTDFEYFKKRRRNNRILEKFYDAKYTDIRDHKKKPGSQLSCGRTNRKECRHTEKNERIYRGQKVSEGKRSIRKKRYPIRPGDILLYENRKVRAVGVHNHGTRVMIMLDGTEKSVAVSKTIIYKQTGGWQEAVRFGHSSPP